MPEDRSRGWPGHRSGRPVTLVGNSLTDRKFIDGSLLQRDRGKPAAQAEVDASIVHKVLSPKRPENARRHLERSDTQYEIDAGPTEPLRDQPFTPWVNDVSSADELPGPSSAAVSRPSSVWSSLSSQHLEETTFDLSLKALRYCFTTRLHDTVHVAQTWGDLELSTRSMVALQWVTEPTDRTVPWPCVRSRYLVACRPVDHPPDACGRHLVAHEWMDMTLDQVLHSGVSWTDVQIDSLCHQLDAILHCLRKQNIVHGFITAKLLWLDYQGHIKLAWNHAAVHSDSSSFHRDEVAMRKIIDRWRRSPNLDNYRPLYVENRVRSDRAGFTGSHADEDQDHSDRSVVQVTPDVEIACLATEAGRRIDADWYCHNPFTPTNEHQPRLFSHALTRICP